MIMFKHEDEKQRLEKIIIGAAMNAKVQKICANLEYIRNGRDYAFIGAGIGLLLGATFTGAGIETESMLSNACYLTAAASYVSSIGFGILGVIKHFEYENPEALL